MKPNEKGGEEVTVSNFLYMFPFLYKGVERGPMEASPLGPLIRELPELSSGSITLASLLRVGTEGSGAKDSRSGSTLLAEGIPPVPTRLMVENIRAWQYVDLAKLLPDPPGIKAEESLPQSSDGQQVVLIQSLDQVKKKKKINDTGSWCQAYASLVAALASSEATSKEELVGLMAHQHVVLQMQKD